MVLSNNKMLLQRWWTVVRVDGARESPGYPNQETRLPLCREVLFAISKVVIVYQQLCGALKAPTEMFFWEVFEAGSRMSSCGRWQQLCPSQMIASPDHCTLISECAEGIALSWQETKTVCCWDLVHLNWNGVKPGQMVSQISTRPLWFWVVSLAVLSFMHFKSYSSHHLAGALNLVSKFWLCWGGMQPDAASTIGFTLVGGLPFGWGLPERCLKS